MAEVEQRRSKRSPATRRIAFFSSAIALFMAGLIVRLGYLQITTSSQYSAEVVVQGNEHIPIPAPRGKILDVDGRVLATNVPDFSVVYIRRNTAEAAAVARRLSGVLGMNAQTLYNLMKNYEPWSGYVTLKQDATALEVSYIEEHRVGLPGIILMVTPQRVYPMGAVAAHELGYIGPIQQGQTQYQNNPAYNPAIDQVGQAGLEEEYERYLHGRDGDTLIPIGPSGTPTSDGTLYKAPVPGDNLVLNMNAQLERIAERDLYNRIQYLIRTGNPNVDSGTIVVLNVHTGAVLAMASYPSYNPNWWVGGISNADYQKYLSNDAGFNRAISGTYMPGSTEKMLTALAALTNHEISPNMMVDDRGGLQVGNYWMSNWNQSGFGTIGLETAIEVSDDTYFYQVGLDMGHYNENNPPQNIAAWLAGPRLRALQQINALGKQFGLTAPTGIDLPGEQAGYIAMDQPGTLYELAGAAIGQQEAYTTIGLATYIATIANGGYRYQPEMVHEITSPSGRVIKVFKPHLIDRLDVSPQYLHIIQQGLELATHGSEGTGTLFFGNDPVNVAGKTGTAETSIAADNNSVFVGYAPYNHPQIAVAAIIPNTVGEGFMGAAPLSQQVIDAYFAMQHK